MPVESTEQDQVPPEGQSGGAEGQGSKLNEAMGIGRGRPDGPSGSGTGGGGKSSSSMPVKGSGTDQAS